MGRVRKSIEALETASQSGESDEMYRAIIGEGVSLLKTATDSKDKIAALMLVLRSQQILDKNINIKDVDDDFIDDDIDEKIRIAAEAANEYVEYDFNGDDEDE